MNHGNFILYLWTFKEHARAVNNFEPLVVFGVSSRTGHETLFILFGQVMFTSLNPLINRFVLHPNLTGHWAV